MEEKKLNTSKEEIPDKIMDAGDGTELESTDDSMVLMDKPFDPALIRIETKIQSLDSLIKRIDREVSR